MKKIQILLIVIFLMITCVTIQARSFKYASFIGVEYTPGDSIPGRYQVDIEDDMVIFQMSLITETDTSWVMVEVMGNKSYPVYSKEWKTMTKEISGTLYYSDSSTDEEYPAKITKAGCYTKIPLKKIFGKKDGSKVISFSFGFEGGNGQEYYGLVDYSPMAKKGNSLNPDLHLEVEIVKDGEDYTIIPRGDPKQAK